MARRGWAHCWSAGPGSSILVALPQPCGRCLPLLERYVPLRGGPVSGAWSGPPVSLSHGLRAKAMISSSWECGAAGRCACITVVWAQSSDCGPCSVQGGGSM